MRKSNTIISFLMTFLLVLGLLSLSCIAPIENQTVYLYVNGEATSIQNVYFFDHYVVLPMEGVLLCLGGRYTHSESSNIAAIELDGKRFVFNYAGKDLTVDAEDDSVDLQNAILPTADINNNYYVDWAPGVYIDHYTLARILDNVGITIQIECDYKNKTILISKEQSP